MTSKKTMELFSKSEAFQKERPTKLTQKQKDAIWVELAKEVIDNSWSSSSEIEEVVEDLQGLSISDSGYEKAKSLEDFMCNSEYRIDTEFIEWLDNLDSHFDDAKRENVRRWVEANNIKPRHQIGTELAVKADVMSSSELRVGRRLFVNTYWEDQAMYGLSGQKHSKRNALIAFEVVEKFCEVVKNSSND